MPTTKRRRRGQRSGLTLAQLETLLHGQPLINCHDADCFQSDNEEQAAWRIWKPALMAEWNRPGSRPAAYFRWDLGLEYEPMRWWDELAALESRGLLSRDEQFQVERTYPGLAADQPETYCDPRYCAQYLSTMSPDEQRHAADRYFREAQFIAGWHERRGRPDLAAKYQRRAAIFQSTAATQ